MYMRRAFFIVPLLLIFLLSHSEATKKTTVEKVRHSSNKSLSRVVVDLDGPINFTSNSLSNPVRLYFNLENCILSKRIPPSISINDGVIKSVRIAQFDKETVRVVFDLYESGGFYAFTLETPHRLVIDVYVKKTQKQEGLTEKKISEIRKIVIDPGHGGKDPGAIGPRGLREKDVVLDVAKKLGGILKKKYDVEVIYTRDGDIFVPLNERTEIANSNNADLFISIHANASRKRYSRGIETYILNWTNDEEAMRVAARENAISFKNMQKAQDELQIILLDLARNNKRDESIRLAYSVQDSLVNVLNKNYEEIEDLGVKQALFYVLVGAEMPSVLVEISFISNREEEKRLADDKYRYNTAEAIAKGIESYIKHSELIVKRAGDNI